MNRCPNCNVNVYNNHAHCPLCNTELSKKESSSKEYIKYKYGETSKKLWQRKIVRLALVLMPLLLLLINIFTYRLIPYWWSVVLIVGSLYTALFLGNTLNPRRPLGSRIILNYLLLFLWCLVIELSLGFQGWSLEYILPLSGVVASIVCVVDLFRNKHLYEELIVYILLMILIDLVPSLIIVFRRPYVMWPTLLAFAVSILMIIIMLIYNRSEFKNEIKKRTHS